jgi:hypothetical protein
MAKNGILKNSPTNSLALSVSSQPIPRISSLHTLVCPSLPQELTSTNHMAQVKRQAHALFFAFFDVIELGLNAATFFLNSSVLPWLFWFRLISSSLVSPLMSFLSTLWQPRYEWLWNLYNTYRTWTIKFLDFIDMQSWFLKCNAAIKPQLCSALALHIEIVD